MKQLILPKIQEQDPIQVQKIDSLFGQQQSIPNNKLSWIWQLIKKVKSKTNESTDKMMISQRLSDKYFFFSYKKQDMTVKKQHFNEDKNHLQGQVNYATEYQYQVGSQNNFLTIQQAVQNIKQLMGYVLLFNCNIESYEFIDQRCNEKNLSFSVRRVSMQKVNDNVAIFRYQISQQFDLITKKYINQTEKQLLVSIRDKYPIAAIPVEINNDNKWTILKINQNLTQVFKQFPLIGTPPLGWNAIINSKHFHTNQQGSDLWLRKTDKINQQKVNKNLKNLSFCFEGIKDLYVYLAMLDCNGVQNLLTMQAENIYSLCNDELKSIIKRLINYIISIEFIPSKKGGKATKCRFKQLSCIQYSSIDFPLHQRKLISVKLNRYFSFLYPYHKFIDDQFYQKLYEKFQHFGSFRFRYATISQHITHENCLKDLQTMGFSKFQDHFKQKKFQALHHIYETINLFKIFPQKYLIFLNDSQQFKSFQPNIMMRKNINKNQQNLLDFLKLEFRDITIHEQFGHHFIEQIYNRQFNKSSMESLIRSKLGILQFSTFQKIYHRQLYVKLFLLLLNLKVLPYSTQMILRKFKMFDIQDRLQFQIPFQKQEIINDMTIKKLLQIFLNGFSNFFISQAKNKHFNTLLIQTTIDWNQNIEKQMIENLYKDQTVGKIFQAIPLKLTMAKKFVHQNKLRRFKQGVSLPNQQDIIIYEILKNQDQDQDQQLTSLIVLDIYPEQIMKNIRTTTYHQLFSKIKENFIDLHFQDRQQIMRYVQSITQKYNRRDPADKTVQQKYLAWEDFLQSKTKIWFDIREQSSLLKNQKVNQFLYQILRNPKKLQQQAQNYFKRKSPISSSVIQNQDLKNNVSKKKKLN